MQGITFKNIDFMKQLEVEELSIRWGAMNDLQILSENQFIKNLELWRITKLSDISFISKMLALEKLHLVQLSNVEKLPCMNKLKNLKFIHIDDCKKLNDITAVKEMPALKELHISAAISEEGIKPALENNNIEIIKYFCGRTKQINKVNEMIIKAGKKIN